MNKLIAFLFIIMSGNAFSQAPLIQSIDKDHGAMGEVVTIKGNNFGDKTKLEVFFGAVKGIVLTATDHIAEVEIPRGATHDYISLLRKDLSLTGYSSELFYISFGGTASPIAPTDFGVQIDKVTAAETGSTKLYNLCTCDLNNDDKPDIITANNAKEYLTILPNGVGTDLNSNFNSPIPLPVTAKTLHVSCGDLNNDGKYDIVTTTDETDGRLFYFQGNGNYSFTGGSKVLNNSLVRQIQIADLDMDGLPEVILSNVKTNEIIILPNTSNSVISFGEPIRLTISVILGSGTDALQVKDLDNDNVPDIIVSPTLGANVYVLRNKSTTGNFQFNNPIELKATGQITALKVGDLDNDGKSDIAVTKFNGTKIEIIKNISTQGNLLFENPISLDVALERSWGLDFGDLNGDGKLDIVVPHITPSVSSNPPKSKLTVLENQGGLNFGQTVIEKNDVSRYVRIVDLNADGKPEIAGISIDIFLNPITRIASTVFIIPNNRCMLPKITPEGPIRICDNGTPVQLVSTKGGGVTYQWKRADDSIVSGETTNTYAPITTGAYKVVSSAPGCPTLESNIVSFEITNSPMAITPLPITMTPEPGCTGTNNSVTLTASLTVPNLGVKYKWDGPADFSSTPSTNESIAIPSSGALTLDNAGYYKVSYLGAGDCVISTQTKLVSIINMPAFSINLSAGSSICVNGSTTLSVFPSPSGYDYQWFKRNTDNTTTNVGANNLPYTANTEGKYFARIKVQGALCSVDINDIDIIKKPEIAASFSVPAIACTNQEITFQNNTTGPEALTYSWTFGDNKTSTERSPKHVYASQANSYSIRLVATYSDGSCADEEVKSLQVIPSPPLQITTGSGKDFLCEGGTELIVTGTPIESYNWSNGETTPSITALEAATYRVTVKATNGCELNANKSFSFFPSTPIFAIAEPSVIDPGQAVQLSVEGLTLPEWSPVATISDPKISNPTAMPVETTEYVVKGIDVNGCTRTTGVKVEILTKATVTLLNPKNFFSPNADAIDDLWSIGNIENFPRCGVVIYDEKGVKVHEAKPYNNDWNGTFNGTTLPDGVYYFIIRCDGEEAVPRSGSITLIR
jgi:gliding motility-associated-like protein